MLRVWLRRQQKRFANGEGPFTRTYTWGAGKTYNQRQPKPEGEVTFKQVHQAGRKVNTGVGDYVEFEEVEIIETEIKETEATNETTV